MAQLIHSDRGLERYDKTLALQRLLVERVIADPHQAYLLTVEHPPVITLGRSADETHVLIPTERLKKQGIEIHSISRGGDVTYHGPGQLVAYPIMKIDRHGLGVREYLRRLEEVVINVLAEFGITAGRIPGLTGVWAQERKLCAMGVAVRRWVAYHGLALNVCTNMNHFNLIVPCGISDKKVASMTQLIGTDVAVSEVRPILVKWMCELFDFQDVRQDDEL